MEAATDAEGEPDHEAETEDPKDPATITLVGATRGTTTAKAGTDGMLTITMAGTAMTNEETLSASTEAVREKSTVEGPRQEKRGQTT